MLVCCEYKLQVITIAINFATTHDYCFEDSDIDHQLGQINTVSAVCGALGRVVEHSTTEHWAPGSRHGVFKSGALSSFMSLLGARPCTHNTLATLGLEAMLNKEQNSTVLLITKRHPSQHFRPRGTSLFETIAALFWGILWHTGIQNIHM